MPRKVKYATDYDDDYGYDYDVYDDYDHGEDVEEYGERPQASQAVVKPGTWRCSICTYDNDKSLSSCDICGVVREPSVNHGNEKAADDMYKDSGASLMAKSLFSSLPRGKPKISVIFQQLSDDFLSKGATNSNRIGDIQGHFNDFQKAFMAPRRGHYIDIAPFKFDTPSPDDIVSAGKKPSGTTSKVNPVRSSSLISSNTNEKKGAAKALSNGKRLESSTAPVPKASQPNKNENHSAINKDQPQAQPLASSFQNLSLDTGSGSSKNSTTKNSTTTERASSRAQYKPETWMLSDKEKENLNQLSLAIVGHVDSGKSTLSGRLLHLLGRVSQKEMHKYEKEARQKGKGSFAYAWALDESAEERERGITMTVGVAYFESKKYRIVVLDAPGHKDFVPNMISGATQADAAVLVVDASIGSFEAGMEGNGGGQTKEHAQLIRSFGVEQIIVAVNKMDVVEYSKERFDFIKLQLGAFLRSCGFKDSLVTWIPLSAMENQNLVKAVSDSRLSSWYQGPSLLDAIDSLQPPVRDISKPLRLPICDVIKSHSLGQVAASGKLEAGAIRSGSKVLVMPSADVAMVRTIERDSQACIVARAGDNVSFSLQGIEGNRVRAGGVLCHPDFPVSIANHLELKILILDIAMPILTGSEVEFHIHHAKEAARVVKILSILDPKTGKASKRAPRLLVAKQSAVIEVVLDRAVCVEEFSKCRALGRVFLRASGKTVGVGIVTRILDQESSDRGRE